MVPFSPLRVANAGQRQPKAKAKKDMTRCRVEYSVCEGEEIRAARAKNKAESLSRFLPARAVSRRQNVSTKIRAACKSIEDLTTHLTGESSALSSLRDWAMLLYPGKK